MSNEELHQWLNEPFKEEDLQHQLSEQEMEDLHEFLNQVD